MTEQTMNKITRSWPILVAAGALGLLLTGAGCQYRDPCAVLAAPTSGELAVVQTGAEVERELSDGTECDLVNGTWTREPNR